MGRKRGPKKDKFSSLSDSFKDAVAQSSTDEIRKRVSEIAILDCTERALLKINPDVAAARSALKNLMEPIRENMKAYKLQIEYCKNTLDSKGGGGVVTKTVVVPGKKGTSQEEFKNSVGDALEKALGKDKVQRDASVSVKS